MPDGDFRRPPRLWEEQLQATVDVQSVGISSLAASTVPTVTMPDPGGVAADPAPPHYADISTAPAAPTLAAIIGGLAVTWTGLDVNGDAYPEGMHAEVHTSTSTGFTPSSSTMSGTLSRAGTLSVTGLASGTTYYVKLVVVDEQAQRSTSAQATLSAGYVTTGSIGAGTITAGLVSFDASAIGGIQQNVGTTTPPTSQALGSSWVNTSNGSYYVLELVGSTKTWVQRQWASAGIAAGAIDTLQLAAGAVTAEKILAGSITATEIAAGAVTATQIAAGAVTANKLDASAITGKTITGGTITGATFTTTSGGSGRIVIADSSYRDQIRFYYGGTATATMESYGSGLAIVGGVSIVGDLGVLGLAQSTSAKFGNVGAGVALEVASGAVYSYGVDANTTTSAANVRVGASAQLLKSTSTARVKDALVTLSEPLAGVDSAKITGTASVDPFDVLALAPTEFASLCEADDGARTLGFIAEDVAAKFPFAAEWDTDGLPSSVQDRPILAALLAVVQSQQAQIADLTARVEALEG